MHTEHVFRLPAELLSQICCHIYCACLPAFHYSLDPLIIGDFGIPKALPSSMPPGHWNEQSSRYTLHSLCLVDHAWYEAAKPWLWRKIEIRLPRSWLALVEEIIWDQEVETVDQVMENTVREAAKLAIRSTSRGTTEEALKMEESILESITMPPDEPVPLELLSPVATREPSPHVPNPKRLRHASQSPARWELMRAISNSIQNILEQTSPGRYVPTPHDTRPGQFVRHLDFNHFRTIGMRRSVEDGVNSRFVTGSRVESVLKELPSLSVFGATEYMDGGLTISVLNELFLRGTPSQGRGRPTRGRAQNENYDAEMEARERWRQCTDLEAVDFTGCVSAVFVNALAEFVATHLSARSPSPTESRAPMEEPLVFPGLQRICLRGAKSILPHVLHPLILALPNLTHLDISGTRATPELLEQLGQSTTVHLKSLSIGRCVRLTGECIRDFLVHSPATEQLSELSLYGDVTFPSPLSPEELMDIFTEAPCFVKGNVTYLDISSAPVTREHLNRCPSLPSLRSLGLSFIATLSLTDIANFLSTKVKNIEILTIIGTSPELHATADGQRRSSMQASMALHTHLIRPLCTPPFSFSLSFTKSGTPPTNLRVIELSTSIMSTLGAGAGSWRIIRSKGGRSWYVDTASGWVSDSGDVSVLRRDLPENHPLRVEMEKLSNANGNVSAGVGWHARKMEVLLGHGMFGREDGLYGAVSFAYQG